MAEITAQAVNEFRKKTGLGLMECKTLLKEADGDEKRAIELAKAKHGKNAENRAGRATNAGRIEVYVHHDGKQGAMVEVNCETDFVARNEAFVGFTRDVAMQIAAMNAQYVSPEEVPQDAIAKERAIRMEQAATSGKPAAVIEKMVDGQIKKWLQEICLIEQAWVKDNDKTISAMTQELVAKLGENVKIRRFARFELGEGLEKKQDDFAAEVAKQAGLA